jgi:cell division protein ZapB
MLDDLDTLARKVTELAQMAHSLRTENQQLRAQLVAASAELETLRGRVEQATRRLDAMLERLPATAPAANPGTPWNT